MSAEQARLADGRVVEFVRVPDPPDGTMKVTFFAPDKSYVVQFFKDSATASDPYRLKRLEAILGKYNPTSAGTPSAQYLKDLFCWPTGIVVKPELGIVAPAYPSHFLFGSGDLKGKEKKGNWFSSPKLRRRIIERMRVEAAELGTWINYFQICIRMARAVRKLHQSGLAHSDLSTNNVLVDPTQGRVAVIDIDSLVVPGIFPADVLGTRGYIAPEVLRTSRLGLNDPNRRHPGVSTDQHALPVLIYESLLHRHPLIGPKIHAPDSDEDDHLALGERALYIEHLSDKSNRPRDLAIPATALGPELAELFRRAFVDGLPHPGLRPSAFEWERALVKTWDLLIPCSNARCPNQWFVVADRTNVGCPFCGTRVRGRTLPLLRLRMERRPGTWVNDGLLAVYHQKAVFQWHAVSGVFPDENVGDRRMQAYFAMHEGRWLLVNQSLNGLTSPGGTRLAPGQALELKDGASFRLSSEPNGRMADVELVQT